MAMRRNNGNYRLSHVGGNCGESFYEHDEHMRVFCRSHANASMVNAPRCDESSLIEVMRLLEVKRTIIETGGSRFPNSATEWSTLLPLLKVARYKLSQN